MEQEQPEKRIGARALRSAFWAYSSYVSGRLLVLLATAVLARVLTPEDFGLVALALVFMAVLETVKDLGLAQALVASRSETVYERADTVFVVTVGLGVALSVVVAAMSPLSATFFDEPELTKIMPVLGLTFLIRSLGATHYAIAQKEMRFKTRLVAELADVLSRGITGVALAFAGAGAWSLVIGYLIGVSALVLALWVLIPWRPRLRIVREHLRRLLRFGGALTGVDVLSTVISNADYVFVGKALGPAALGVYTLAFRLPELAITNVANVAGQVLFPAFANVDRAALAHTFTVALRYVLTLCMPLAVWMALLSEPLVEAAFGSQWDGAVAPMQVLTLYAFAVTVGIPGGTAYKAMGRADILFKLAIPHTIIFVTALALLVDRGLVAVAGCHAGVTGLFTLIGILIASRMLDVPLRRLLGLGVAPAVATAAVATVVVGTDWLLDSAWSTLLVASSAGALVYVATLSLIAPDTVRDLRSKLSRPAEAPLDDITGVRETDVVA
jgi:O-antigen/teichoic acid export membrane protein